MAGTGPSHFKHQQRLHQSCITENTRKHVDTKTAGCTDKLATLISGVQLLHKPHTDSLVELKLYKWKTDHQSSFGLVDQSDNPHQSLFSCQISITHLSMHKVALNKMIAAFKLEVETVFPQILKYQDAVLSDLCLV